MITSYQSFCTAILDFTFQKIISKLHNDQARPTQPFMTTDTAIRVGLHFAEVVHFTHKIRYIHRVHHESS